MGQHGLQVPAWSCFIRGNIPVAVETIQHHPHIQWMKQHQLQAHVWHPFVCGIEPVLVEAFHQNSHI